jgi:hypothetical protein
MHYAYHFVISLIIATFFYLVTGNIEGSIACFVAGTIIDIDHILDCFLLYRNVDFRKITDHVNHTLYKDKVIVSFHSIEIAILLPALAPGFVTTGIALGMFTHMLSDFLYYRHERQKSVLSLFFIYRLGKGFSVKKLCT